MPITPLANSITPMEPREFKLFRTLVHNRTGIWLRDGKQIMLASRLSRRLRHLGMTNFTQYYAYVQTAADNGEEIRELINCVTTNKTSFFRENHHFEFLATTIVPAIQSAVRYGGTRSIRIWSAASSTGEEPYSIAITLLEALQANRSAGSVLPQSSSAAPACVSGSSFSTGGWRLEIVASDIDTRVLATAKRAIYSSDSLESVPLSYRRKYFLCGKDDMRGRVKVKSPVASLVHFKRINLMDARWHLDGLFDVIFFRNALIYFNQDTQEVFLRKMVGLLKPRGYLFLGNAEHIPWMSDVLEPLKQTMHRLRDVEP